jgi:iron-sulfur cluster repair protein YtfE (RIC family)
MLTAISGQSALAKTGKPSDSFRSEHVELRKHLDHYFQLVGKLPGEDPATQKRIANDLVSFLKGQILPHAAWEEKALYPEVDKRAGNEKYRFTSTMRQDHEIVGRWVAELASQVSSKTFDSMRFGRRTDELFGLLYAHFEKEESVLLPILGQTMSKQDFDKVIMGKR